MIMEKEELIKKVTDMVAKRLGIDENHNGGSPNKIVAGISVRHVHLKKEHINKLFGKDHKLIPLKDLSQPGQYAAREVATLLGQKLAALQNVRILGPPRNESQIELSKTDCIALGIDAPTRVSGDIKGSAPIVIVGPKGSIDLKEGAIRAERHIHINTGDAKYFKLKDRDYVDVKVNSSRGLTFNNVVVRISDDFKTEFHIDTDDANTCDLENGSLVEIVDASCIIPIDLSKAKMEMGEIIPPTIPDQSGYIKMDDLMSQIKVLNSNGSKKRSVLTASEIEEIMGRGDSINKKDYILTPQAIDYLKENKKP